MIETILYSHYYQEDVLVLSNEDRVAIRYTWDLESEEYCWEIFVLRSYGLVGNPFHVSRRQEKALTRGLTEDEARAYVENGTKPELYCQKTSSESRLPA